MSSVQSQSLPSLPSLPLFRFKKTLDGYKCYTTEQMNLYNAWLKSPQYKTKPYLNPVELGYTNFETFLAFVDNAEKEKCS